MDKDSSSAKHAASDDISQKAARQVNAKLQTEDLCSDSSEEEQSDVQLEILKQLEQQVAGNNHSSSVRNIRIAKNSPS